MVVKRSDMVMVDCVTRTCQFCGVPVSTQHRHGCDIRTEYGWINQDIPFAPRRLERRSTWALRRKGEGDRRWSCWFAVSWWNMMTKDAAAYPN